MGKGLQGLTIKDNFMFAATMLEEENCRALLECIFLRRIERVDISYEKSIVYHPEYKGVRLDVFCVDEKNTHFNVEMQVADKEIKKRARYYHSQVDMEILLAGAEYEELPDSYVIFICDFDPFGYGKYCYTVKHSFKEVPEQDYEDGAYTIFLSTKGKDDSDVSKELVAFLKFAGANLEESEDDFHSELVERMQRTIRRIKQDREMRSRYMLFEEMMRDEFKAGKAELLAELVARKKAKGLSVSQIADLLEQDEKIVEKFYHEAELSKQ